MNGAQKTYLNKYAARVMDGDGQPAALVAKNPLELSCH
jgi:hypothetical protein